MRRYLLCLAVLGLLAMFARAPAQGPKLVEEARAFETLVNPNCSHCKDEAKRRKDELKADDRVLCWTRGKYDGGAIPFRFFLNRYRVISDTYGVFVYDADAGFARAFEPSLDFTFHGWRNGVLVMKHKDGTLYSALNGQAFAGPKKGNQLKPVPTIQSDWGWWLKRYPDTVAYHLYPKYKVVDAPTKPNASSLSSRGKADPRLPIDERVLGVSVGKHARAYRIAELKKSPVVLDTLGDTVISVFYHDRTKTATAYQAVATRAFMNEEKKKRTATLYVAFELDAKNPDAPFRDKTTGSSFDIAGRCVAGSMKGATLMTVDAVEVKWFAWAAEYPDTTIHGKKAP
jgi:hypothetical protein